MRAWMTWLRADRSRLFAAALGLALLVASTVWFATARDDRGRTSRLTADAWYYHAYLPSLVYDGDLDFTDQYRITRNWYRFGQTPVGRPANVFGIGPAVFELPFFALGADITRATGERADGFSTAEVKLSLYASVLFSLGALFFAGRVIRRRLGGPYLSAVVPVVLACAGPVAYYAIRQPGYAHPFATFWTAWLIDRWDQSFDGDDPRGVRSWLAMGALLGAAALARMQLGLWAVLVAVAAVDDLVRHRRAGADLASALRGQAPAWAAGAAVCFLCIVPQLLAWNAIYGDYFLTPQGEGFMRWDDPAWSEVLFSSRNGLFPWAPLYAAAAVGLLILCARRPRLGIPLAVGVALQTVTNGAAWDWWAGGSFGGRRFDSCFAPFAIGLAALLVWPARSEQAPALAWTRRVGVGAGLVLALLLAAGNLVWASKVSAPSARIYGAQAAHKVLRKHIPGSLGGVVARASELSNWPARALFARRHGTGTEVYDYVVGHHVLGELYPGLNSFRGKTRESIPLLQFRRKLVGVEVDGSEIRTTGDGAEILVGLNRFGPVTFELRVRSPAPGALILRANGGEIARATADPDETAVLRGTAAEIERGINVIELEAPPGTRLLRLVVTAPPDPRRK